MNTPRPYSLLSAATFVAERGIVLASAKGAAPRLVDAIAGEQVVGNWWSHPRANEIYNILAAIQKSEEVLVCRLLNGKITLVHRRLWPALVRIAAKFEPQQLAMVAEEHAERGHHMTRATPFPEWVPSGVLEEAKALSEGQAVALLEPWLREKPRAKPTSHGRRERAHDA